MSDIDTGDEGEVITDQVEFGLGQEEVSEQGSGIQGWYMVD